MTTLGGNGWSATLRGRVEIFSRYEGDITIIFACDTFNCLHVRAEKIDATTEEPPEPWDYPDASHDERPCTCQLRQDQDGAWVTNSTDCIVHSSNARKLRDEYGSPQGCTVSGPYPVTPTPAAHPETMDRAG